MITPWGETRTIAGKIGGGKGYANGLGVNARFNWPYHLDVDALGNVYVSDYYNQAIRRLRPVGATCDDGNPCTIDVCDPKKGCSHTPADAAKVCPTSGPCIVAKCEVSAGKCTYTARPDGWVCASDCNKQCNRGTCSTAAVGWTHAGTGDGYADGQAPNVKFRSPWGLAIDDKDNLYVSERYNHRIRLIAADGTVSTFAGSAAGYAEGMGTAAKFSEPLGLDRATDGTLYVADYANHRIRKISPAGKVSTLAGSVAGYKEDVGSLAKLSHPVGVLADNKGGVYVADTGNHRIRHIAANGTTSHVAGSGVKEIIDGSKTAAKFYNPYDLAFDGKGGIYVADATNNAIRRVDLADGRVTTVVGADRSYNNNTYFNGRGTLGTVLRAPIGLAVLADGSLLITDASNHSLRHVWPNGGPSETWAGVPAAGYAHGIGTDFRMKDPREVVVDSKGDVFIADDGNDRIRKLSISLSKCSHLTGISQYTAAKSCKSILPQYKWSGNSNYWVDPDGGEKDNAIETTCDMKSDGGGWTRVDQEDKAEVVNALLGGKGRMMLKCSDAGVEHLVSPATSKTWAWSNKKHALAGDWLVKNAKDPGKTVTCGDDGSFDELDCGWGYGCSDGKDKGKNKLLPGVKSTVQCTNTTTAQTDGAMSICGSAAYSKWRVFVRSED